MTGPSAGRAPGSVAGSAPGCPAELGRAITPHYRSQDLFGQAQEVMIEHKQRTYRLRLTAQGKLILTA